MASKQYDLSTRAKAIELIMNGHSIADVSREIGAGVQTVSAWFMKYIPYKVDNIEVLVLKSKVMDEEKYVKRLKEIIDSQDTEGGRYDADQVLCDALEELGYTDIVDEWRKQSKLYA